jgi:hypothetical protein
MECIFLLPRPTCNSQPHISIMRHIAYGVLLIATDHSTHAVLRGKSQGNGGLIQPNIQVPSLETVTSPETFSGIAYDPDTTSYSFDLGSTANALNTAVSKAAGGVITTPLQVDYGMANTAFQPPAVSYATPLNEYTPPVYFVSPCSSANNYADGGCIPGSSKFNIGMNQAVRATR